MNEFQHVTHKTLKNPSQLLYKLKLKLIITDSDYDLQCKIYLSRKYVTELFFLALLCRPTATEYNPLIKRPEWCKNGV